MVLNGLTKSSNIFFLYNFVNWAKVYIKDHTLSMFDSVDWLFVK